MNHEDKDSLDASIRRTRIPVCSPIAKEQYTIRVVSNALQGRGVPRATADRMAEHHEGPVRKRYLSALKAWRS